MGAPLIWGWRQMPNVEPHCLSATDIVRMVEGGELTAEAVVASCLERIVVREPVVRAWAFLAGEAALALARAFDRAGRKRLLGGVPFGLKDIFDAARMPATYGSPIYTGWWPPSDASAAALPKAAGGILLGKTITTEFANRQPGPTANPHDPAFTPGGSSSGSAAAVADFMVPLAIGTQTGGSVIRPAAYCGVVGFKPSFGLFPPAGMKINTETLDTVGIMARGRRRHRSVPRGCDGDPVRSAGDAADAAAPRPVPRPALGRRRAGGPGGARSRRRLSRRRRRQDR